MKGPLLCLHVHTCDKGAKEALWPWTASKDRAAYEVIIFPVPCPPSRQHSQRERRTPCPSASDICCRRGSASWQNNRRTAPLLELAERAERVSVPLRCPSWRASPSARRRVAAAGSRLAGAAACRRRWLSGR